MRLPAEASQVVAQVVKDIAGIHEERKAFALTLRSLASLLDCGTATLFRYKRAGDTLYVAKSIGGADRWDMETVMRFFRNEKPELGHGIIMAPVRVGHAVVGVVALARDGGFERGAGKVTTEILRTVGSLLGDRKRNAILEAEAAIARAVLGGVAPKDVVYRIFHQMRRFIDYDHGATLVERLDERTARVAARQVAWTKGKSTIVGITLQFAWPELPAESGALLDTATPQGVLKSLGSLGEEGAPPKLSIMVGPLTVEGERTGCVEVGSTRANFFVDTDADILTRFLPYLSWCLRESKAKTGGCHG